MLTLEPTRNNRTWKKYNMKRNDLLQLLKKAKHHDFIFRSLGEKTGKIYGDIIKFLKEIDLAKRYRALERTWIFLKNGGKKVLLWRYLAKT